MIKLSQQTRQTLTFFNKKQAYLQGPRQDMLSIKKTNTLLFILRGPKHGTRPLCAGSCLFPNLQAAEGLMECKTKIT